MYTTWGPVRQCCGHVHLTVSAAEACIERDMIACKKNPTRGYSDRRTREINSRHELIVYNVESGPGKQIEYEEVG